MISGSTDILLVGGGVMSTTLAMLIRQLDPELKVTMVERLGEVAHESTDGWNNAGTGHAAYCELNYTPEQPDGSVAIDRALQINAAFETSLQFWSYLVETGQLPRAESFINRTPHLSLVWGEKDVRLLRKRFSALSAHHLFRDMEYSEDPEQLADWVPLAVKGRYPGEPVAATRVAYGTDVDFGSLTRHMIKELSRHSNFDLVLNHSVKSLFSHNDRWHVTIRNDESGTESTIRAGFVFLGAGGATLPLLQKTGLPEAEGYGGFPVSGQWLVCNNPDIVRLHSAKVYGQAPVGAPPMSVPHLDTRIIDGKPALLFGPFAGFTTRFLKNGSLLDLPASLTATNFKPVISAGFSNLGLTMYLIKEVLQSHESRISALRTFYPGARSDDWQLKTAGQRVQVIKKTPEGGMLRFGTEVVSSGNGTLAALLGASPGASISVQTMLNVLERCFPQRLESRQWQAKLQQIFPAYGHSLTENPEILKGVRNWTLSTLGLKGES